MISMLYQQILLLVISDDELNAKIRSLNQRQRECFDIVYNWGKNFIKQLSTVSQDIVHPLHIFITKVVLGQENLI